jgi:hypothetical protein
VHEAASGVAALEVWATHRDTDPAAPQRHGHAGWADRPRTRPECLQAEAPELKVVLTSGYSPDNPEAATARLPAQTLFAVKLARIVRACLDGK